MKTIPQTKTPAPVDKMEKVLVAAAGALSGAVLGNGWTGAIIGGVIGFLVWLGGERARKKENRGG